MKIIKDFDVDSLNEDNLRNAHTECHVIWNRLKAGVFDNYSENFTFEDLINIHVRLLDKFKEFKKQHPLLDDGLDKQKKIIMSISPEVMRLERQLLIGNLHIQILNKINFNIESRKKKFAKYAIDITPVESKFNIELGKVFVSVENRVMLLPINSLKTFKVDESKLITIFKDLFLEAAKIGVEKAKKELSIDFKKQLKKDIDVGKKIDALDLETDLDDYIKSYSPILAGKIAIDLQDKVKTITATTIASGGTPVDVKSKLKIMFKSYHIDGGKVNLISRTESMRFANWSKLKTYEEEGIKKVEWIAVPDACPICVPLDGQIMLLNVAQRQLPKHGNCRCSTSGVVE